MDCLTPTCTGCVTLLYLFLYEFKIQPMLTSMPISSYSSSLPSCHWLSIVHDWLYFIMSENNIEVCISICTTKVFIIAVQKVNDLVQFEPFRHSLMPFIHLCVYMYWLILSTAHIPRAFLFDTNTCYLSYVHMRYIIRTRFLW